MAAQIPNIPVVKPDYDLLKAALRDFFVNQEQYKDYNFDGSALSTLLGVLSLNSHYTAFYLNQVANEAFLSTLVKRFNGVKKARYLGYSPRTISSTRAVLQLEVTPTNNIFPTSYTIVKPTFTSEIENLKLIFQSDDTLEIELKDGVYVSSPFEVIEGKNFILTLGINNDVLRNGVTIPNFNVDSNSIKISINDDNTTNYYNYELVSSITELDSNSRVFYCSENENGLLDIRFGDGILGKRPNLNSAAIIQYQVSSGSIGNYISSFTFGDNIVNANVTVRVVSPSFNGDEAETLESIKLNAPLFRTTQDRAVNDFDYKTLVKTKIPNIQDVTVFGGEELNPPKYGRAIIVPSLKDGLYLTEPKKADIVNVLKKYNVVGIRPLVLEPEYTFINVNTTVSYNRSMFNSDVAVLKPLVKNAIFDYEAKNINGFNKSFRFSTLSKFIDNANNAIISNITRIQLEKQYYVNYGTLESLSFQYNTELTKGTFFSSTFDYLQYSSCFIEDVDGILNIYANVNGLKIIVAERIGVIDYISGKVSIPKITIVSNTNLNNVNILTGEKYIGFYGTPSVEDVIADKNLILKINTVKVDIKKVA